MNDALSKVPAIYLYHLLPAALSSGTRHTYMLHNL